MARGLRYPNVWTPAVTEAAATRLGQTFLGFSRFPAARSAVDSHGVTTVRWTDMRFVGGVDDARTARAAGRPFTATVRFAADGHILEQRIVR